MPPLEMLRSATDFQAIQADSRSRADRLLLLRYRPNTVDRTRFGISTGRRMGSAVVRNRARRRVRTILRSLEPNARRGWDVLLVLRPAAAAASQAELDAAVRRLAAAAGLLENRSPDDSRRA